VLTHTIPLPAGGGAFVPADGEVFAADFAGAAAGAAAGAGPGADVFDAAAGLAGALVAGAAAAAGVASALALLFLLVAAGVAAGVVAAGAVEDPGAALSVESAAVFFDRDFFAVVAESLDASGAAVAPAVVFFALDFFAVVPESLDASGVALASAVVVFFDRDFLAVEAESVVLAGVADESAAVDFVFFVLLVESAALSVVPALESAAVFFLDLLFDVPLAEESDAAVLESESAVVVFFVFFLGVLVVLSALESLDASCARSSVVNRNKPISAAIATMKTFIRRFRFILILRVKRKLSRNFSNSFAPRIFASQKSRLEMPRHGARRSLALVQRTLGYGPDRISCNPARIVLPYLC